MCVSVHVCEYECVRVCVCVRVCACVCVHVCVCVWGGNVPCLSVCVAAVDFTLRLNHGGPFVSLKKAKLRCKTEKQRLKLFDSTSCWGGNPDLCSGSDSMLNYCMNVNKKTIPGEICCTLF